MNAEKKIKRNDMIKCVLCQEAPCSASCPVGLAPDRILRHVWFDNEDVAAACLPPENSCLNCDAPCEGSCVRARDVPIRRIISRLYNEVKPLADVPLPQNEVALATDFCGIPLENPFLLSSSVVASTYDMCARAFESGWAGAAFKTICNFPICEASPRFSAITGADGAIIGFKNVEQLSDHSLADNMDIFQKLKAHFPNKLLLVSIMGRDEKEWEYLAHLSEENGADALELNFSCPNMMDDGLGSDVGEDPALVERFTAAACRSVKIPVLAKLTPNAVYMSPAAEAAKRGGAKGIAAINTIKSIMDINPHTHVSSPSVRGRSAVGGYSGNAVRPIALRFIAELGKNPRLAPMHISGMGGVETWRDALEFLLLGAGSVQVTTAVMQYGYRIIEDLKAGLNFYLTEKAIPHVGDITGSALEFVESSTDVLERGSIVYPKFRREKCLGCGRCVISCADGGHQAISLDKNRRPILQPNKCVGCHLCVLVCPNDAIVSSGRRVMAQRVR